MPTISVFIRQHDLPKWQALENKSQWLHDHLPGTDARSPFDPQQKPIDTSQDEWDESIIGQVANAGFRFLQVDDDGTVHATKGDPAIDDNHYYFDVKYGKVIF